VCTASFVRCVPRWRSPHFVLSSDPFDVPLPNLAAGIEWRTPKLIREWTRRSEELLLLDRRTAQILTLAGFGSRPQFIEPRPPAMKWIRTKSHAQTSSGCAERSAESSVISGKSYSGHPAREVVNIIADLPIRASTLAKQRPAFRRIANCRFVVRQIHPHQKDLSKPCSLSALCIDCRSPSWALHPYFLISPHDSSNAYSSM
jgi:hypothetical protein